MIKVSDNRALNFKFRTESNQPEAHRCVGGNIEKKMKQFDR